MTLSCVIWLDRITVDDGGCRLEDDGETDNEIDSDKSEEDVEESNERKRRRKTFRPNVSNVLNGLPNWMDRLLEGSIRRYYIPEWPDNLH